MFFFLYLNLTLGLCRAVFPVHLVSPIGLPAYQSIMDICLNFCSEKRKFQGVLSQLVIMFFT